MANNLNDEPKNNKTKMTENKQWKKIHILFKVWTIIQNSFGANRKILLLKLQLLKIIKTKKSLKVFLNIHREKRWIEASINFLILGLNVLMFNAF